ncbi:MAG: flavin reductase family protein [Bacteriovoracaceae bacterium]|nr:flavin reductase family protein [Bacteriovoracaceae bacterium]
MKVFDTNGDFRNNYKFLIGAIQPRPIAWVSTLNKDGTNNLAPFSFFNGICAKPMLISFCPAIRASTGEKKDTLVNIEREKEFVVNFVNEDNYEEVNLTSAELPYGIDEFKHANLTALDSLMVKAKRVKESPIHFECKLRDILHYGEEIGNGSIIIGEVLKVHVDEKILNGDKIITDIYKPVGRGAGNDWYGSGDRFEMERLMKAQIQK